MPQGEELSPPNARGRSPPRDRKRRGAWNHCAQHFFLERRGRPGHHRGHGPRRAAGRFAWPPAPRALRADSGSSVRKPPAAGRRRRRETARHGRRRFRRRRLAEVRLPPPPPPPFPSPRVRFRPHVVRMRSRILTAPALHDPPAGRRTTPPACAR